MIIIVLKDYPLYFISVLQEHICQNFVLTKSTLRKEIHLSNYYEGINVLMKKKSFYTRLNTILLSLLQRSLRKSVVFHKLKTSFTLTYLHLPYLN